MDTRRSTILGDPRRGATLAVAAAALFLAGCGKTQPTTTPPAGAGAATTPGADAGATATPGDDAAAAPEVKCFGINECSGQSACDVPGSHDCGGQNSCRGKGWILVPQGECDAKGGKVV
jgi:hypothetical protein